MRQSRRRSNCLVLSPPDFDRALENNAFDMISATYLAEIWAFAPLGPQGDERTAYGVLGRTTGTGHAITYGVRALAWIIHEAVRKLYTVQELAE